MALEPGLPKYKKPVPRKYRARLLDLPDVASLRAELGRLRVDPGGVYIMQTKGISRLVLLEGISPKAANIIKQEALARGGDLAVSWKVGDFRPEPADVLLMGTLTFYRVLVEKLLRQSVYDLQHIGRELDRMLTESAPGYRAVTLQVRRRLRLRSRLLPLGEGTRLMAELDIPAGGSAADGPLRAARSLAALGEPWLGLAGSEPGRVALALQALREQAPAAVLAAAAANGREAEQLLDAGADLIEWRPRAAATAAPPPEDLCLAVAERGAGLMLSPGLSPGRSEDPLSPAYSFFCDALEQADRLGVAPEQVLLDPTSDLDPEDDALAGRGLMLMRRLREFASLGRPLVFTLSPAAASRWAGHDSAAGAGSLTAGAGWLAAASAAASFAVGQGADVLRLGGPGALSGPDPTGPLAALAEALHVADSLTRGPRVPETRQRFRGTGKSESEAVNPE